MFQVAATRSPTARLTGRRHSRAPLLTQGRLGDHQIGLLDARRRCRRPAMFLAGCVDFAAAAALRGLDFSCGHYLDSGSTLAKGAPKSMNRHSSPPSPKKTRPITRIAPDRKNTEN